MLLRRRAPGIEHRPAHTTRDGYEHLDGGTVAVLRWLTANDVDFVLVGAVAEAIRGRKDARGPVAIVPAPYARNYERLERALWAGHARQRAPHAADGEPDTVPVKVTAEKLSRGHGWALRCGTYDVDIEPLARHDDEEGEDPGAGFQQLLYETTRVEIADGVSVEVASHEDIEHYAQLARTGRSPKLRISRAAAGPASDRENGAEHPEHHSG